MPITIPTTIRRLSQAEFGELAYAVMRCVFQIHSEFGRFFDEKIYKRELAQRFPGVGLEVPIEVSYATFTKFQYLDVLVAFGGLFEFKSVEAFVPRHPAQLLHYLLIAELGHGKLVNVRTESVEHVFVNTTLTREDRIGFEIIDTHWSAQTSGAKSFRDVLVAILRDWGTGLDLLIYEDALTHFLGGELRVLCNVKVCTPQHTVGHQKMRLAAPRAAFMLTALPEADVNFESHLRRLHRHSDLEAILWVNIALKKVTFTTIR
jgi:GxxExxY protein